MSYPRNSATPPTIGVGEIRLLADGTLQTTGASVRVLTAGGSWGAGGGSLNCDVTSGLWTYTPTQAETDGEWFIVAAYKANCTGCQATVVTSASGTAGHAYYDWAADVASKPTIGTSTLTAGDVADAVAADDTIQILNSMIEEAGA